MKIYITHYTPLKERKENIIKQLNLYGINNYEFIEVYDRDILTKEDLDKFSHITLSETSLFLKHIEIFKKESNNNEVVIVLEDDAIFVDNFKEKLDKYIEELKNLNNWDVIFTAECCNLHIKNIVKEQIFYSSNGSRGTCMYILNVDVCKKILNIIDNEIKICKPIDHWFNLIQIKYYLNLYWSEPTLVHQGSEIGIFKSQVIR